jgi:hypothetical protein
MWPGGIAGVIPDPHPRSAETGPAGPLPVPMPASIPGPSTQYGRNIGSGRLMGRIPHPAGDRT